MAFLDSLQYRTENLSLYFQGGVRRSVLIFAGICLLLLAPFYFLGQFTGNIWNGLGINPTKFNDKSIVVVKNVQENALEISSTQIVPLADGSNSLYLTINNKANSTIGYYPFVYTVQILNSTGTILKQQTYNTYLLPGDIKYVVAQSPDASGTNLKIIREPQTRTLNYNPSANQILKNPNIQLVSQNLKVDNTNKKLQLNTTIKNLEAYKIKQIDFLCIIRGTRQEVVGIFEYTFDTTFPGERSFTVDYPLPKERTAATPDVRWTVNYLDENTFILN